MGACDSQGKHLCVLGQLTLGICQLSVSSAYVNGKELARTPRVVGVEGAAKMAADPQAGGVPTLSPRLSYHCAPSS